MKSRESGNSSGGRGQDGAGGRSVGPKSRVGNEQVSAWDVPGSTYQRFPDIGDQTPLRAVMGILLGVLLFLILAPVASQGVVGVWWLSEGRPVRFADYASEAARFQRPAGMLGANLGIAALLPLTLLLLRTVNRAPCGWVWSVTGRPRWRYLAACAATSVAGFAAAVLILGPSSMSPAQNMAVFVTIILVTSPLQAAAEEVFFRGYLAQGVGTLTGQTALAVIGPAVLFALWHGTQNLPLIASRFAFGLLAGVLTWRTGGLEAAVAVHVANNLSSYLPALLSGTLAAARTVTEIAWPAALYQIGVFVVVSAVAWGIGRRARLQVSRRPDPGGQRHGAAAGES